MNENAKLETTHNQVFDEMIKCASALYDEALELIENSLGKLFYVQSHSG